MASSNEKTEKAYCRQEAGGNTRSRRGRIKWYLLTATTIVAVLIVVAVGIVKQRAGLQDSNQIVASVFESATARDWKQIDNPAQDGWKTEYISEEVNSQLKVLAKFLAEPDVIRDKTVSGLAHSEFTCEDLRPSSLQTVFSDAIIRIERTENSRLSTPFRGPSGLANAIRGVREVFQGSVRAKFKLFSIRVNGDTIVTKQYLSLVGRAKEGRLFEENSMWSAEWRRPTGGGKPLAVGFRGAGLERSTLASDTPLFVDCTESVLAENGSYRNQILYGYDYWLKRIQDKRYFSHFGTPGLAVGDINGDGLDDLYVCQEGGLPNLLFVQNRAGTARDVSEVAGVNFLESSRSALLLDFDNDGDQDLAVAVFANVVLSENDGAGRFTLRTVLPTTNDTFSLCSADYDDDGDVDLYVCGYMQTQLTDRLSVLPVSSADSLYHDANDGAPNNLFRNDSTSKNSWQFTDVTDEVGLDVNNRRYSFAATWEDFDNDGDQDIYVANDLGRNNLYRNDGGRFVDIADIGKAEDIAFGMGVTCADFDRDGWMDVYVSNMFSAAGTRVTQQEVFKRDSDETVRARIQRSARGNTLMKNLGDGTFSDVSEAAGVTMGRWAWSSNFVDFNNDGWEDLVVANGNVTTEDTGDL